MLYVLIATVIGLVAVAGILRLVVLRSRAARRQSKASAESPRRPAADHYAPTVGTSSARKSKSKKAKRESLVFHPVPPEERKSNQRSAGQGGKARIKRRRDRERDNPSSTWSSSADSSHASSYDSPSSSESSSFSSSYDSPSYDTSSYDTSSDHGSGSSDSSWSSSSDSSTDASSGGDFGGGGSSDSY